MAKCRVASVTTAEKADLLQRFMLIKLLNPVAMQDPNS